MMIIKNAMKFLRRFILFLFSLVVFTLGFSMIIKSGLGNDTVSILAQGVALQTGLTVGQGSQIINLVFIVVVLLIKRSYISWGTFVSALGVGYGLDLFLAILPKPELVLAQCIMLIAGIIFSGMGIAVTIHSNFGSSPFDSFMMMMTTILRTRIKIVRIIMDTIIAAIGWLMGGSLGVGTILTMILFGPVIEFSLKKLNCLSCKSVNKKSL